MYFLWLKIIEKIEIQLVYLKYFNGKLLKLSLFKQ